MVADALAPSEPVPASPARSCPAHVLPCRPTRASLPLLVRRSSAHRGPVRRPPPPPVTLALAAAVAVAVFLASASLGTVAPARAEPQLPLLGLPVEDGRIVALARIPEPNWLPGHRGIDIAADAGATVRSPGPGRVAFIGTVAGRPVIAIELDTGLRATLEPAVGGVDVGARVARGSPVGALAPSPSHCGLQACLHWGLKEGERYVDPLDWLAGYGRVVLLPAPRHEP